MAVNVGGKEAILHAAVSKRLPQAALIGWDATIPATTQQQRAPLS